MTLSKDEVDGFIPVSFHVYFKAEGRTGTKDGAFIPEWLWKKAAHMPTNDPGFELFFQ